MPQDTAPVGRARSATGVWVLRARGVLLGAPVAVAGERSAGSQALISIHDDATSRLLMARFVARDNGAENRLAIIAYPERHGRPVAVYTSPPAATDVLGRPDCDRRRVRRPGGVALHEVHALGDAGAWEGRA